MPPKPKAADVLAAAECVLKGGSGGRDGGGQGGGREKKGYRSKRCTNDGVPMQTSYHAIAF